MSCDLLDASLLSVNFHLEEAISKVSMYWWDHGSQRNKGPSLRMIMCAMTKVQHPLANAMLFLGKGHPKNGANKKSFSSFTIRDVQTKTYSSLRLMQAQGDLAGLIMLNLTPSASLLHLGNICSNVVPLSCWSWCWWRQALDKNSASASCMHHACKAAWPYLRVTTILKQPQLQKITCLYRASPYYHIISSCC